MGRESAVVFVPFRSLIAVMLAVLLGVSISGCQQEAKKESISAKSDRVAEKKIPPDVAPVSDIKHGPEFVGSQSCHDCHEGFYKLWSTSFHGLAMQPYTPQFAREKLTLPAGDVTIAKNRYRVEIDDRGGRFHEWRPDGEKTYPIEHVMGGKNVYYFLTPMERGRLQVLPLAYDVHKKTWYDTTASGVRHFPDRRDEALPWTDRMFTFNTTCFNCHVSQLRTNYDLAHDTYKTTWSEPGISCESCHGPGGEHLDVMVNAPNPHKVQDIKIIRTKGFTTEQMNDMCATCHAKLVPLSLDFVPGEKFFDHFDLVVLDHPDYYSDGRDLGENYTFTSWLRSPCANSGKLDCNHCHTASGRMRYTGVEANKSCAPCHQKYVDDPASHGHHAAGSKGNECIGCHTPTTRFAAMGQTNHSMLPPTPATTIAYKSPNACNICHEDKDAAWSDSWVRKWYPRDYQAPVMERASLLDAARRRDWKSLPAMLEKIGDAKEDAVYKASLVRLVRGSAEESKWPALTKALQDKSPLVRSSAAAALAGHLTGETIPPLLKATRDPSRLVRIRAAAVLAPLPTGFLQDPQDRKSFERAAEEFMAAMKARPDDWAGYANLGTFYMDRREFKKASELFETAARLEPRMAGPMVNASIAYTNMGKNDRAEASLRRALKADPNNAAALFNLGLLLAEEDHPAEAEKALRAAVASDPQMAAAAFNLGVLCGEKRIDEAIAWCRKAQELEPGNAKYAHTMAFFLHAKGEVDEAIEILRGFIQKQKNSLDVFILLGGMLEEKGEKKVAAAVYRQALSMPELPPEIQRQLDAKIKSIEAHSPEWQ